MDVSHAEFRIKPQLPPRDSFCIDGIEACWPIQRPGLVPSTFTTLGAVSRSHSSVSAHGSCLVCCFLPWSHSFQLRARALLRFLKGARSANPCPHCQSWHCGYTLLSFSRLLPDGSGAFQEQRRLRGFPQEIPIEDKKSCVHCTRFHHIAEMCCYVYDCTHCGRKIHPSKIVGSNFKNDSQHCRKTNLLLTVVGFTQKLEDGR